MANRRKKSRNPPMKKGLPALIQTHPYGRKKRKAVLKRYFEEGFKIAEIERCPGMPSRSTIQRWVSLEKVKRQTLEASLFSAKPRRGRPSIFSESEIIAMKEASRHLLQEGKSVTRSALREAIGRDTGPRKVALQRISDVRHLLHLSHKRPVAMLVKERSPGKEHVTYKFLCSLRRIPRIDLHFFDEKPLRANTPPKKTLAEVGVPAIIQKENSDATHYTQLMLCNVDYGFKCHRAGGWSTQLSGRLLSHSGSGTNRAAFYKQMETLIRPVLQQAYEKRRSKVQHLLLDEATIHKDDAFATLRSMLKPYAQIHYIPSIAHTLLSPLDYKLFRQQQAHYSSLPNSTEEQVREAVATSSQRISAKDVKKAVHEIGYGMRRSAGK